MAPTRAQRHSRTAPALKLWVVAARAVQAIETRAAAHVGRHGLTLAEFAVLEALHHKGPLLSSEVQRKILVSSGGITYVVDRLAAKGLVERRPCPNDRRARYVALTKAGAELIARIFPEHADVLKDAMSGLTSGEQRQATELLRKLGRYAAGLE